MKCSYPIADHDVYVFTLTPIDSKMYCIVKSHRALVIDPCLSDEAKAFFQKGEITDATIFLTHEHIDHISGVNMLREICTCRVICSKKCAENIIDARRNTAAFIESMYQMRPEREYNEICALHLSDYTCRADEVFEKEGSYDWEGLRIRCIEMPGHSPGGIAIIINDTYVFSGDNYIPGIQVITRLPGGNSKEYKTITKPFFDGLSDSCVIYPGHGDMIGRKESRKTQ